jgi:hypothetical protein
MSDKETYYIAISKNKKDGLIYGYGQTKYSAVENALSYLKDGYTESDVIKESNETFNVLECSKELYTFIMDNQNTYFSWKIKHGKAVLCSPVKN